MRNSIHAAFTAAPWIVLRVILASEDHNDITAGHTVTLLCRASNTSIIAAEWRRPDQQPEYVLLARDGHFDPAKQHPSFKNRVDLQDGQMKDGDVLLILQNVTINDGGTYECRVFVEETRSWESISIVYLRVSAPPGPTGGTSEDGSVGLIVGLSLPAVMIIFVAIYSYKNPDKTEKIFPISSCLKQMRLRICRKPEARVKLSPIELI